MKQSITLVPLPPRSSVVQVGGNAPTCEGSGSEDEVAINLLFCLSLHTQQERERRAELAEAERQEELHRMHEQAEREWYEAAAAAHAAGAPMPARPANLALETPDEARERRLKAERLQAAARVRARQVQARRLQAIEDKEQRQASLLRQVEAAERIRQRHKLSGRERS